MKSSTQECEGFTHRPGYVKRWASGFDALSTYSTSTATTQSMRTTDTAPTPRRRHPRRHGQSSAGLTESTTTQRATPTPEAPTLSLAKYASTPDRAPQPPQGACSIALLDAATARATEAEARLTAMRIELQQSRADNVALRSRVGVLLSEAQKQSEKNNQAVQDAGVARQHSISTSRANRDLKERLASLTKARDASLFKEAAGDAAASSAAAPSAATPSASASGGSADTVAPAPAAASTPGNFDVVSVCDLCSRCAAEVTQKQPGQSPRRQWRKPAQEAPAAPPWAFKVGDAVLVDRYGRGTIRYAGPHATKPSEKLRYGVQLDEAVGLNAGTVDGHRYFTCPPKSGVLVTWSKLKRYDGDPDESATTARKWAGIVAEKDAEIDRLVVDGARVTKQLAYVREHARVKVKADVAKLARAESSALQSTVDVLTAVVGKLQAKPTQETHAEHAALVAPADPQQVWQHASAGASLSDQNQSSDARLICGQHDAPTSFEAAAAAAAASKPRCAVVSAGVSGAAAAAPPPPPYSSPMLLSAGRYASVELYSPPGSQTAEGAPGAFLLTSSAGQASCKSSFANFLESFGGV